MTACCSPEPRTPVWAVLFDYGGVLAEEGFVNGLRAIAAAQGLDLDASERAGADAVHASGYVTGRGTESRFWALWRSRTGARGEDAYLRDQVLSRFMLRPAMIELVRALRRTGVVTAILSDQTDWLDELEARDRFFREFEKVYNSFRLGKSKRDASIFSDVVRDLGFKPAEVLFADDKPGHVERARSQGLQAMVFRDQDSFLQEFQNHTQLLRPEDIARIRSAAGIGRR